MVYQPPAHYHVKVRLYNEEIAFGKGIAQILQLVEQHGSLRAAYQSMGMSSSKAWKILHRAENDLGFPLLKSSSGGTHGGSTELTPEGRELLLKYMQFDALLQAYAEETFKKIF